MSIKLIIIFVLLNVVNVIVQTIKSIATIKCGKTMAAIINAVTYGFYTVVIIYMTCELPLWLKATIVGVANLIGVYVVKLIEEKKAKEKLWKVEATIHTEDFDDMMLLAEGIQVPFLFNDLGKYFKFEFYCSDKKQSHAVREILIQKNAKFFVSESKNL